MSNRFDPLVKDYERREAYRLANRKKPDTSFALAFDPLEDVGGPWHIKAYRVKAVQTYAALRARLAPWLAL